VKVRYVHVADGRDKLQTNSSWLTVGTVYHVLEIIQDTERRWMLRLVGDNRNGPALFELDQFEIITSYIPRTWIIVWGKEDFFELSPRPWTRPGFWEQYYDGEPDAVKVFEEERKKIIEAEP
jgi:hypothetical protein